MLASESELASFRDGVEKVTAMLPAGDAFEVASGIGRLGAAIARIDSSAEAYAFADKHTFECALPPQHSFSVWRALAFVGVPGALEQARVLTGVVGQPDGSAKLREGVDLADANIGSQLIELVGVGDRAVIPLARQSWEAAFRNPDELEYQTRHALRLYRAGDDGAIDLALRAAQKAKAVSEQDPDFDFTQSEIALWSLAERMIKRGQVERLDDVVALIETPEYLTQVAAALRAADLDLNGNLAERAVLSYLDLEELSYSDIQALNKLVATGFPAAVAIYRELFIEDDDAIENHEYVPDALAALHKAGEIKATNKLLALARDPAFGGHEASCILNALRHAGLDDERHRLASRLFRLEPSRLLLKDMLLARFTTADWDELWNLPIDYHRPFKTGEQIYYRANDVLQLAGHLIGEEILLERKD